MEYPGNKIKFSYYGCTIPNMIESALSKTVVFSKDWHKGVIGIVASRLIEQHYKPTIVFA